MSQTEDLLGELLKLPAQERARAARALLDSLDEGAEGSEAEEAQVTELIRRMSALDSGQVQLVDHATARARVAARLRSIRAK